MLTATIHGVRRRWLRAFGLVAALVAITALAGTGSIAQAGLSTTASAQTQAVDIDPALYTALDNGESPAVLVRFRGKADLSAAFGMSDRDARATYVYQTLTHLADKVQAGTRQMLASQFSLSEAAHDFTVLWIDNSIAIAHLTAPMLAALQTDPNVASIREQRVIPLPKTPEVEPPGPQGTDPIVSSMEHIHVPDVWAEGFKGAGIVVANIDTGVRYTHHALVSQYRGNLGGGTFDHNFNWYDPYSHSAAPRQSDPHGSHTMGTMVGDNVDFANGGTIPRHQVGAAPDAQWMACLGFNPGATDAALIECGQWTLAPYPTNGGGTPDPTRHADIVSNSWGDCSQIYNPFYEGVITAWVAAGIAPIFSNGNSSNCGYPTPPPLNTVGSPGRSGKVLGIGATGTDNGVYANFSNKGTTDNLSPGLPNYPDPRGFANLKPNVSAPGANIFSSWATGDDAYALDSGTSMSSPAVAGVIALVWSAADCLKGDYAQTGTIIMSTATPRPFHTGSPSDGPGDVPNQATGWGEVDALAAVNAAIAYCAGGVTHTVTPSVGTPSGTIAPSTPQTVDDGDTIDFTLTPDSGFHINNVGGTCGGNLAGSVFTTDPVTANCTVIANFASDGGGGVFPPDENFDEVTAPALPAGWTTAASGGGVPWVTDATVSDTAPNSAHASDFPAVSDMTLDTPTFTPAAGATLSFRHQFNLESGFDGAVLEISIGGGAFQDFVDAGGVFTTGGYISTISSNFGSPIAGRAAWSGNSGGFVDVAGTFPAAAIGQPTVLRFRTADDNSVAP
ncbi:MAG TPA: S8 family serine peptidase, partial [Rhodanobacteraceae bacterium]|nr:S8 family serine peptidase [Rhodanobacteraceae bacterium]